MLASSSQCSKRLKPRLQTVRLRDQLEEEHRQMRLFGIPKYTRHQAMKKNKSSPQRVWSYIFLNENTRTYYGTDQTNKKHVFWKKRWRFPKWILPYFRDQFLHVFVSSVRNKCTKQKAVFNHIKWSSLQLSWFITPINHGILNFMNVEWLWYLYNTPYS